ncbi:efflux RND transporter periplasmic adaptor subunit [Paremcibacter congregatus]|uniref:Uncharacterized protein n=1 Tax=Paremcibacter congregatus TaxID=2043170 RepID=A0A2G4YN53_9PROT|nr:efflux RND transporter periplasmic adaptor subunit [Paremcibacter congregatus]PHZ83752.1 hypothetical protein CRD36_15410 [Paremcibacter congregatus]QDE27453.1 efflux RND transporter periplasmic adaptor subunit [Paremcibacter congregatus]
MTRPPVKFLVSALALVLITHSAEAQQPPNQPKAKVRVATAEMTEIAPTLNVPGTVVSLQNSRLAAETSAAVDWVAEVGTQVKKGATVAQLNKRLLQLELVNSAADIKRIKAQLDFRTKDVTRLKKLLTNQTIAESRYDEAISQESVLEQELAQAGARHDRIKYLLEKSEIKAPADGWVVERYISAGEYVTAGAPVVRFVDTVNSEITVQAPLDLLPNITAGMEITVANGNQLVTTRIRAIIPVGDNASRMAEIRLENPGRKWAIGTAVRVSLPNAETRKVLAVPRDALIIRAGQSYIYKIAQDGKAERINIRSGVTSATRIEVTGHLTQGDQVVTRGGETLRPGQEVEVLPLS